MRLAILTAALLAACSSESTDACDPTACASSCAPPTRGTCAGGQCRCLSPTGDNVGGDQAAGDPRGGDGPGGDASGDPGGDRPAGGDAGDQAGDDKTPGDQGGDGACLGEGSQGSAWAPIPCCGTLSQINCAVPDGGGGCLLVTDCYRCTFCGDGACGLGENECNCKADCSASSCIGEGGTGSPLTGVNCCSGLNPISCSTPDPTGGCVTAIDCFVCSWCGDGGCGPGENECNCADDCG